MLHVEFTGEAKEIAALVLELQERQKAEENESFIDSQSVVQAICDTSPEAPGRL